jgi:CubicO group peptidase (beta-lactamase class C family)
VFRFFRSISFTGPVILVLVACSSLPSVTSATITTTQTATLASRIDAYLTQLTHDQKFTGSVLVARQGDILLAKGYGFADMERTIPISTGTRFLIGSMDKQFTAMAILILQAQGKLHLQDSICDYSSECPSSWQSTTIHHLLTHSAGIPDLPSDATILSDYKDRPLELDEIIAIYREKPMLFSPGERFSYSTPGYLLLEHVIENVSGQSFRSFLEQNIFEPLEMNDSDYDCRGENLAVGFTAPGITSRLVEWPRAHSICTTVEDLYSWDQSLYSERLVPSELIDLMFTAYVHAPEFGDMDYGYGWFVGQWHDHRVAGHGGWIPGSGFRSFIQHYPDDKLAVIVLSNQADSDVFGVASRLADIVFGE